MKGYLDDMVPDRKQDWTSITAQKGMFWYYPKLTPCEFQCLQTEYHIWTNRKHHRLMLGGLFESNVKYVASSIAKVVKANLTDIRGMCRCKQLREAVSVLEYQD